ncbi:MAG: hypothetical protein ABIQ66_09375 [Novosphingobium sp.]
MKANLRISIKAMSVLSGLALLAGCASPPPPAPPAPLPPPPRPRPAPAPVVKGPADWRDAAATAGDWRWRQEGGLSVARFGDTMGGSGLTLVCNPAVHTITLVRAGAATGTEPITVTTTSQKRVLSGVSQLGEPPALSATIAANDPLLDAMAFSRGRFMVEAPGFATLYLPSWPEVSRVIEDCR